MPRFEYRATDQKGQIVTGLIEAPNLELATGTLTDRSFNVLSISAQKAGSFFEKDLPFLNTVTIKDLVIFSRQFAVLMGSKVPIVRSVKTVARQTENKRLRKILMDLADEVESGTALSVAMAKYPKVFNNFFVNMIKSGETTGRLEEIMNYLADQQERDFDLTNKIKGAMTYPIVVMCGLVIIGFIMLTFVVPKLTESLKESGSELPWTTKSLIFVSDFMKNNVILVSFVLIGGAVGFTFWIKTKSGEAMWDRIKIRIPVFGDLLQGIYVVRLTRSLATLISGGVDIPGSLDVTAEVIGNTKYRDMVLETKRQVMDGNPITTVFEKEKSIPQMVSQMMSVGEETGRLYEVLEKLTDFYQRELQQKVANLVAAIEPIIMLIMGGAVGIMVAAIMMPMYQMATNF